MIFLEKTNFSTHFIRVLTIYQAKVIFYKNTIVKFWSNFDVILIKKNKLISIFFNSKLEQKKNENQEKKSGQGFQSVTKFLKKMIICIWNLLGKTVSFQATPRSENGAKSQVMRGLEFIFMNLFTCSSGGATLRGL